MPTSESYKLPVISTESLRTGFGGTQIHVSTQADMEEAMEGGTTDTGPGAEARNEPNG